MTVPLTIAGSDPSGGAGLQADVKVFAAYGLSAAAVPTALTSQAPSGVHAVHPVSAPRVAEQLDVLLAELRPAVVKVGLLPNAGVVRVVARHLARQRGRGVPIVVDPVLAASSGVRLLPRAAVRVFLAELAPLATVLTPNLDEGGELTGRDPRRHPEAVVEALLETGAEAVVLKGGHGGGARAVDWLGTADGLVKISAPRVPRRGRVHGTGCAFSSAVAAELALGASLESAVREAKRAVRRAIVGAVMTHYRGVRELDFAAMAP